MARTGLQFLTDMVDGKLPQPPICATLGFHLAKVSDGYARFDGVPEFRHYNPIGTVHGGFAATLLDSALGCAIFTTLAKGEAWTTLELKLNLVRPISKDTGTVGPKAASSTAAAPSRPPRAPLRIAPENSTPTPRRRA